MRKSERARERERSVVKGRDQILEHIISHWNYLNRVHTDCGSVHETGCYLFQITRATSNNGNN